MPPQGVRILFHYTVFSLDLFLKLFSEGRCPSPNLHLSYRAVITASISQVATELGP